VKPVFVFGSNLAGIHGAGAAAHARGMGFPYYLGSGYSAGCYAIPTKDCAIQTLPIEVVAAYVAQFRVFAAEHKDMEFQVTRIGCGLAGFKNDQIAPLFMAANSNCLFDEQWKTWLDGYGEVRYWGTFP